MGFLNNRSSFNDGVYHCTRSEFELSLRSFRKAIRRDPRDNQAWNNLGLVHYKMGDVNQALECFDKALLIKEDDTYAITNKAAVTMGKGRNAEALILIEKVLRISPDDAHALNLKGLALMDSGRLDEAISVYDRLLLTDPGFKHAIKNRSRAYDLKSRALRSRSRKKIRKKDPEEDLPDPDDITLLGSGPETEDVFEVKDMDFHLRSGRTEPNLSPIPDLDEDPGEFEDVEWEE